VDGSKASQESMFGRQRMTDTLPSFVFDPHIDSKTRSKLIEKEMNEQVWFLFQAWNISLDILICF
jgi:hypothetical protein